MLLQRAPSTQRFTVDPRSGSRLEWHLSGLLVETPCNRMEMRNPMNGHLNGDQLGLRLANTQYYYKARTYE
jgi:hypothetical protein